MPDTQRIFGSFMGMICNIEWLIFFGKNSVFVDIPTYTVELILGENVGIEISNGIRGEVKEHGLEGVTVCEGRGA